jgi:Cof subfamily protein (haloacid dehalogenase superfamily)
MKKDLFFFDFDNTIFDHASNNIPANTVKALNKLKEKHRVVIATGRPYFLIEEYMREFDIHDCICFNGNHVVAGDKVLYKEVFDEKTMSELIQYADDCRTGLLLEGLHEMRSTKENDAYMLEYLNKLNLEYPPTDHDYYLTHDVYQMGIFLDEKYEDELFEKFPNLHFVRHNQFGMDVVMSLELKEKGTKILMDYYGVKLEDTYAFGDGNNDLGLFLNVGTSVAMGNSPETLKDVATFVTEHVSDDGLYNALVRLGVLDD